MMQANRFDVLDATEARALLANADSLQPSDQGTLRRCLGSVRRLRDSEPEWAGREYWHDLETQIEIVLGDLRSIEETGLTLADIYDRPLI